MKTIVMNETGRLTVPSQLRSELGLEGSAEFEAEVDKENDALILRPAVVLRREDAWAYTPQHRKLLAKAHRDSKEGRIRRLTEKDLDRLGR